MEYNTKEVAGGKYNGKEVWICDFRYTDFNNKPIRHVKPTKVIVRSITETTKRVYYSNSFFSEIKKDGSVSKSSLIRLYDNTGYRSYPGIPLNVFSTEKECLKKYKELSLESEKAFEKWREEQIATMQLTEKYIQDAVMYEKSATNH